MSPILFFSNFSWSKRTSEVKEDDASHEIEIATPDHPESTSSPHKAPSGTAHLSVTILCMILLTQLYHFHLNMRIS